MFELEIATSTDFSFSRSSQHIFLGFSSQKRCQKRISAKWHPSPKKTFQKMKFLHLIATISRHTTIRLSFHWHQKCRCNQISAALFWVTYIFPPKCLCSSRQQIRHKCRVWAPYHERGSFQGALQLVNLGVCFFYYY